MRKQKGKINSEALRKRKRRKLRIRKTLSGTEEVPRVSIFKSTKNFSMQVVNDVSGVTLYSVHTYGKNKVPGAAKTKEGVVVLASALAEKLKKSGVKQVVFDRNGFKYHGVIAQSAETLRENGIKL